MRTPSAPQLEAIGQLQRREPAWSVLVAWLDENRLRAQEECACADDDTHVRRAQGAARCLAELVGILTPK